MTKSANLLQQALLQHRAGEIDLAEPVYRQIIANEPDYHEAWHLLGVVELQRGRFNEAIDCLQKACQLELKNAQYFNNLGNALGQAGFIEDASDAYRKSHDIDTSFLDPLYNLGVILHQDQKIEEAEELYRQVLDIDANYPGANNNLGAIAKDRGQSEDATELFEKALASDPDYLEARINIGNMAEERGYVQAAGEAFDLVLSQDPSNSVRFKRSLLLPALYQSKAEIDKFRTNFEAKLDTLLNNPPDLADPVREGSRATFFLAYHGFNDRLIQEKISALYRKACPALNFTAPHCINVRRKESKIKIGFVSKYLRNHTIGKLNRGLIALLPKDQFEITIFPVLAGDDDEISNFIATHVDHVVPLASRLEDSMKRIADCEIDILYYTDIGMEPYPYFLAFGRLAPVQCVTWGHPVTTGIDTIDYFISAKHCEIAEAQDHYSEELIRLTDVPTYYYRPAPTPAGEYSEFQIDPADHIYLCAQSLFKIHPEMDQVFAKILEQDAQARIFLIGGNNEVWLEALRTRFQIASGSNAKRIDFVPQMSQDRFMRLLGLADVLLDTFPFSGGNTSLEGFSLGIPIVTLAGTFMRGRVTFAMYKQMGIEEGIAVDKEEYVSKAVRLATEPEFRAKVSSAILTNNHKLFENQNVIEEFATFFRNSLSSNHV